MVVYSQGHVFLEVFKTLRNIGFYSEWKFELINLLLVREMAEDGGPAPVLETLEVPLEEAEAHLSLGCSGALPEQICSKFPPSASFTVVIFTSISRCRSDTGSDESHVSRLNGVKFGHSSCIVYARKRRCRSIKVMMLVLVCLMFLTSG